MIELPAALQEAVAARLRGVEPRSLARAARELSERYRGERVAARPAVRGEDEVLAHAGWFLPAAYAQLSAVLRMIPLRAGDWAPSSLLDLGTGPGTAAWAATALWPDLRRVVGLDREEAFLALARDLAAASSSTALREATWTARDLRDFAVGRERFDLVVVGHVLGELDERASSRVIRQAFEVCGGVLALVEPGTPAGFARIEAARRALLAQGARMIAPCPHEAPCPLAGGHERAPPDWCHFAERLQRPRFQQRLKEGELGWEDAKFACVVVARFEGALPWGRALRHPVHAKGRVTFDLCTAEGRQARTVFKSAGDGWRLARKLEWGSGIEREAAITSTAASEPDGDGERG